MPIDADVLLIGSGAGVLAAALALARAGLRVTICSRDCASRSSLPV
jgi:phytoene dehydrogenase-like protein